jgi:hypothetical protein
MLDPRSETLQIKDGKKLTLIPIPQNGLPLMHDPGNGCVEEVYIPPPRRTKQAT